MARPPIVEGAVAAPQSEQARRLAAQLAAVFVRPLAYLTPDVCATAFPGQGDFAGLAPANPFYAPINRAVSRRLGLADMPIEPDLPQRLEERPATRLCVLLVSQPIALVHEAGKHVAAAMLHKRVVSLVLKSDRERMRSILGDEAYRVATDESALLHGPLVAAGDLSNDRAIVGDLSDEAAARDRIITFGLRVLTRFVALCEPSLAALFAMRVRRDGEGADATLTRDHCDHIVRLLRRRIPAWAATIA